jgi:hypothetical protein
MKMGCRGHDRMVVGFPITCAISAYVMSNFVSNVNCLNLHVSRKGNLLLLTV